MKYALCITSLLLAIAPAYGQLADKAGISGEVSVNIGALSSESSFNTDTDETITDNTQSPSSDSRALGVPLGNIAYTFGDQLDKQVFFGTSREDIAVGTLALELGYKQKLANETVISASVLPTVLSKETWTDPFLEGAARQTTDEAGLAYRLQFSNIAGSKFSLETGVGSSEVDDENSGFAAGLTISEQELLERDSTTYYLRGSYMLPLSRTSFLQPSIRYFGVDADGHSNSSQSIRAELSYFYVMGQHNLALTAALRSRSFDEENPIYGKKRDDDAVNLFAAYEYQDFMGWKDWAFLSFVSFDNSDSDVDFYDTKSTIVALGLGYKF
jgi:hypothetical protein